MGKTKIQKRPQRPSEQAVPWHARYAPLLCALFILLGTIRITATYSELSRTGDEQAHIACGMEYLDRGTYTYEPQHPPLTRAVAALLPYLNGAHSWGMSSMWYEGGAILYRSGDYERTLKLARTGILLFFWIGGVVVYLWGARYFDPLTGVIAVAIYSFTPTVLAHAGLATTDMGLAAFCGASLLSTLALLEHPNWGSGLIFGLILGLTVCTKFSFLAFYPVCLLFGAIIYLVLRRRPWGQTWAAMRPAAMPALVGSAVALFTVWAVYRFSFGTPPLTGALRVPFPELFAGIQQVIKHNDKGHMSYLLGKVSPTGFWYYYPVALMFKLPIPLLLLIGAGIVVGWKRYPLQVSILVAFSMAILAVGAFSRINIGIRHVLPLFLFFSLLAAVAVRPVFNPDGRRRWSYRATIALLIWFGLESLFSHPDYLAYFNEFALGQPERILVDSDLDWQQDFKRAAKSLHALGATSVAFWPSDTTFAEDLRDFPPLLPFDPVNPTPGWNLIGITSWKAYRYKEPAGAQLWMDRVKPFERIGKGMLLYYVQDGSLPASAPVH